LSRTSMSMPKALTARLRHYADSSTPDALGH
jgi:hypothetical protein